MYWYRVFLINIQRFYHCVHHSNSSTLFDLCSSTITTLHDYNMYGSLYFLIQHFIPFGANISTLLNPTFRPFWGQHFDTYWVSVFVQPSILTVTSLPGELVSSHLLLSSHKNVSSYTVPPRLCSTPAPTHLPPHRPLFRY